MTIHVFDFDGVLAHPIEDALFRMEYDEVEEKFLSDAAKAYSLPDYSHPSYTRHAVSQHILAEAGVGSEVGPLLGMAQQAQEFYVLSARSIRPSVIRAMKFLEKYQLEPVECFFMGRGSKNPNLEFICRETTEPVIFYDDTLKHIESANELSLEHENLTVQYVDNTSLMQTINVEDYYQDLQSYFYNTPR